MMVRRCIAAATTMAATLAVVGLLAGVGQAVAAHHKAHKAHHKARRHHRHHHKAAPTLTFTGACTFPAIHASTDNGAGFSKSAQVNAHATGTGTCTGTANGQAVSRAPTSVDVNLAGRTSCVATMPDVHGSGTLTVAGTSYPVTARLVLTGGMFFTVSLSGKSGSASGMTTANLIAAGMDPHSGLACLSDQTTEVTLEPLTLRTHGPLVLG